MNPYREIYDAILAVIRADSALASRLSFIPINEIGSRGVARRKLDEGDQLKVALVPLPNGQLENISSSSTRATEQYELSIVSGSLPLDEALDIKWLLLKAFWNSRDLNLTYVENVDVLTVTDVSDIGTSVVDGGEGDSVAWQVAIVIEVRFILNRTTLPMS